MKYFPPYFSYISSSVSSPDETPRRELKYDAQRSIFDELRGVSLGDEKEANA